MEKSDERLIVALDVDTFEEARELIDQLSEVVEVFKVGSQLFTACGPVIIRYLHAKGKKVFLDLKFHDIPNTVANAMRCAVRLGCEVHNVVDKNGENIKPTKGIFMCSIHTCGGKEMLIRAANEASQVAQENGVTKPLVLGITVLTSEEKKDNISDIVLKRARLAKESGLSGVVASSEEASFLRRECGKDLLIITPGIRPQGTDKDDQKRVTTPAQAIENGSNYIVIGRPIVKASDPLAAAKSIIKELP